MKIQVVFYSMYGHVYRMAEAVARAQGRRVAVITRDVLKGRELAGK